MNKDEFLGAMVLAIAIGLPFVLYFTFVMEP